MKPRVETRVGGTPPQSGAGSVPDPYTESADLFDYALIRDCLVYVLGSIRRHRLIGAAAFVGVVALTAALLWSLPRTYHAETKLLAQRNQVIASLSNSNRSVPWDADAPTKAAAEIILRRDNIVALVRQTNLLKRWGERRAPALRVKDALMRLLRRGRELPEEDQIAALEGLLGARLTVAVESAEGAVTIGLDWPDAAMAYLLVEAAQRNFLEARHVMEVSSISEAISILEAHGVTLRKQIERDVDEIEAAREAARKKNPQSGQMAHATARPAPGKQQNASEEEAAQLKVMLEAKRRSIADLEEFRRRRVGELQTKLAEMKKVYSDVHPAVIDLKQQVEAVESRQSLQLVTLEQEEQELEAESARRGIDATPPSDASRRPPAAAQHILRENGAETEDVGVEEAKGELRYAMAKYVSTLERIDSAGLELASTRAAFKYRYSIIEPAEMPREPIKPKVRSVMAGGVLGGLLVAICLAVAADLRSRRIHEPWQIERQLGLTILGEVRLE